MAEHSIRNAEVVGSTPTISSTEIALQPEGYFCRDWIGDRTHNLSAYDQSGFRIRVYNDPDHPDTARSRAPKAPRSGQRPLTAADSHYNGLYDHNGVAVR